MGIGGTPAVDAALKILSTTLTTTGQYGVISAPTGTSAATGQITSFYASPRLVASVFTCAEAVSFRATDAVKVGGLATVNTQMGFAVDDLTAGALNYGFRGGVTAGVGKYNLMMDSSAHNFLAGKTQIGTLGEINAEYTVEIKDVGASRTALYIKNGAATPAAAIFHNSATAGDNVFMYFATEAAVTTRGGIDFNRVATATRYNTTSDARLKTKNGAARYDPTWIERIACAIFDVTWKESGHRVDTFVAQDLHAVEPDAVSVGDDGPLTPDSKIWGVDPSKLVAKLILEVNRQAARIAALESK